MKNKLWILYLLPLLLVNCAGALVLSEVDTENNIAISESLPSDSKMETFILPYKVELEKEMNSKIGHTDIDLTKVGNNSSLGNLFADYTFIGAQNWAKSQNIEIDAAVINIGGLRTGIGKGDVLLKHVFEVMPFENELVVVKMNRKAMEGLFQYYATTLTNNPVSNLIIETADSKLIQTKIAGESFDPNKTYYIATSDYLAFGGDRMTFFQEGETILTDIKLRDLYVELIKKQPEIKAPTDIRLIFNPKKTQD